MSFSDLPLESNWGIAVNIQDQTTELVDLYISQFIQDLVVAVNTFIDDYVVTITTVAEPIDWHIVCLKEWNAFYQWVILSHVANSTNWDVTLDTPLDYAFTVSWWYSERSIDLNVDWSVTPQIFDIWPAGGWANTFIEWDVVRVLFTMEDNLQPDWTRFWWIIWGISNWLVLRKKDWLYKNIFNVKTNWEFADRCYDVAYDDRASNQSDYYVRIRRTFWGQNKNGVVIRLKAVTSEVLQVIIQDDLTSLLWFRGVVQWHLTTD